MINEENTKCGFVAIIGKPNVGKSSLLNAILGKKISITSHRAQTTRHRILGVKTVADIQTIYVDTPGMHLKGKTKMNDYMNKTVKVALVDVDVIVFVVAGDRITAEDEVVFEAIAKIDKPVILAINKIDLINDKAELLPHISLLSKKREFAAVVPMSVEKNINLEVLQKEVALRLPQSVFYFPADQYTDKNEKFMIAELIRERLMRDLSQELPYSCTVELEKVEKLPNITKISAIIWVEREGQKSIIIGEGGQGLKDLGTKIRMTLERQLDRKVFLQTWVKVKSGWSNDERALKSLGYDNEQN